MLLSTASTRVLVNGRPEGRFGMHAGCAREIRYRLCYSCSLWRSSMP
jgi:hypothetical protein